MSTTKSMFSGSGTRGKDQPSLSLREQYKNICEEYGAKRVPQKQPLGPPRENIKVGIIGGGIAGLYSGLLLKSQGIEFHIFEANPKRVGGRIYTYRFNEKKDQYFEAGAMRIPCTEDQEQFFQLVKYVNEKNNKDDKVELIDYVINTDNNYVFVNGVRNDDGSTITLCQARQNPAKLNFPLDDQDKNKTAEKLLLDAIEDHIECVKNHGIKSIMKYDNYSMRSFLILKKGWSEAKVDYVETMTSQTQQFEHSFVELIMEYIDFVDLAPKKWQTIKDGMSRLPEACKKIIGDKHISLGAKVYKIAEKDNKVIVYYEQGSAKNQEFDSIILALPPAVIRLLNKPLWSVDKERAIRSIHFQPLYKIGLRFKSRFWEKVSNPSYGGQSTTDLPARWIVYPSYGLRDNGEGVLLCYSWMGDALKWLPKLPEEQEKIALRDLSYLYGERIIKDQFIESKSVSWAREWALGDAKFLPGQFTSLYSVSRVPENNIYFAGEHLSVHHTWILGAIDSALYTCRQLLNNPNLEMLKPKANFI